jgi:hypothetical protein
LFDRPKPTAGCSANGRRRPENWILTFKAHWLLCYTAYLNNETDRGFPAYRYVFIIMLIINKNHMYAPEVYYYFVLLEDYIIFCVVYIDSASII